MATPNTPDIRQYLTTAYSDEDLTILCADYFREVRDNFTTGMTKTRMIELLLDYCQRRELMPSLLAALERDRPELYRGRFGRASVESGSAAVPPACDPRQIFINGLAALLDALRDPPAAILPPVPAAVERIVVARPDPTPRLRADLAHADPAIRTAAARDLARLAAADDATVAALLRLYPADPADAPRHAALAALLALGRAADVGMVFVPAGEFLMGSAADDREAGDDEKPQHKVYLPAYYLDRTPVTNAQYRRFIQAGGYANPAYWKEASAAGRWKDGAYLDCWDNNKPRAEPVYWQDAEWNGDQQPVIGVTWYEALAYARWAGKRLPTEAEWEKAASWETDGKVTRWQGDTVTGKKRKYPWGDTFDKARCNTSESDIGATTPVGKYSPALHPELVEGGDSPCGATDMAGNVFEWCSTRSGSRYPYDPDDGREALGGDDSVGRVLRGSSWCTDRGWTRCAYRSGGDPGDGGRSGGFRCCCSTSSPVGGSGS